VVPKQVDCLEVEANELNPWRLKPTVHHRVHKSPPAVPILSQLNPLRTPLDSRLNIQYNPILSSTPRSFQ
jgi:hypothetical protein